MRAALLSLPLLVPWFGAGAESGVPLARLSFAGSARIARRVLRLTPARTNQAGAAWLRGRQPVRDGFETSFRFRLTAQGGLGSGADGLAFVLQNSGPAALGGPGSAGGFALGDPTHFKDSLGIPRSIAVFFDTFLNDETGDPSNNFITLSTAGTPREMRWPPARLAYVKTLPVDLKDGRIHAARIVYQPPVLTVFLDDARILASTVDLATVIGPDGAAWVGFTASTGSGFENHDILSWNFSGTSVSSDISVVSSEISFVKAACLPDRNLCTPDHATVEETAPGAYHIVLPGNLDWGAAIPNPGGRTVVIGHARGSVCRDVATLGRAGCFGPEKLVQRTADGRTMFSAGTAGEGYFEFDARVQ